MDKIAEMIDAWKSRLPWYEKIIDKMFNGNLANYRPWYSITHPWVIIRYWRSEVEWAWQRVFRGWDDRVVWSIDYYLATNIPSWMRALKNSAGTPVDMFAEFDYDENYNYSKEDTAKAEQKWNSILEQVASGFESYIELQNYYKEDVYQKELISKYETGFDLFRKHFGNFWD